VGDGDGVGVGVAAGFGDGFFAAALGFGASLTAVWRFLRRFFGRFLGRFLLCGQLALRRLGGGRRQR
jgi:hypothetical protein